MSLPAAEAPTNVVAKLGTALSQIGPEPPDFVLQTALNEAWFSNMLAWLLNPKGSHGLGVAFCNEFVGLIARRRVDGSDDVTYARRATFLKWGKEGAGVGATGFGFRNAAVLREYYLSKSTDRRSDRRGGFCDIVLLDLDTDDSFFLAIENKLFTSDHSDQLTQYRTAIDDKYGRASVRELVYLTLRGDKPSGEGKREQTDWVRLSWAEDILGLLRSPVIASATDVHPQVTVLRDLLNWLGQVTDSARVPLTDLVDFRTGLLRAAADCLFEELTRLDAPDGGQWKREPPLEHAERISYTVRRASYLTVELLPGLAVTVQGRQYSGKADFDKIVVPFGAHPDQVFNLLDIAARDVYHKFFESPSPSYLGSARRLRTTVTEMERRHRPIFQFTHDRRFALKPMLLQSGAVRRAVGIQDEAAAEAQ